MNESSDFTNWSWQWNWHWSGFTPPRSHKPEILPYTLYPQQQEWIRWCYAPDDHGVKLLLTAREYGKTDAVAIYAVVKILEETPDTTFIIMSRTLQKSRLIVSTIGRILQNRGQLGSFNDSQIHLHRAASRKQPSVIALSMGSSLKMHHCDYLVLDDPLDPEDEFSVTWKRRALVRFQELSGAIAKRVIVLGQYISEDDLYHYLEKQEGVDVLTAWRGSIPQLDVDLDKLRREGKTPRWIAKNYLGYLPQDETFPFTDIQIARWDEPSGTVLAYLDPSFTGGDYTALSIGWWFQGKIVVRGFVWKRAWDLLIDDITELCQQHQVQILYYEGNSLGFVPDDAFFKRGLMCDRVVNSQNKHRRIYQLSYAIREHLIILDATSHEEYIQQVRTFREGCLFDDAPDSLEGVVRFLK